MISLVHFVKWYGRNRLETNKKKHEFKTCKWQLTLLQKPRLSR